MIYFLRRLALAALVLGTAGAATAQTFTGTMSGSWWDASRGGEGQFITFETVGGRSSVYLAYFTYTADGRATWHVGNTDYTPGATSISIPLVTGTGARFGTAFNSTDATFPSAGTATLEYVSCTRMRLRHTGIPGATLELTRLVGALAGAGCTDPVPPATAAFTGTVSGSWWNASRSGEGQFITFETVNGRNTAYVAYFTYTADGAATWLVGSSDYTAGATSIVVPLITGSGARFGAAFNAGDVRVAAAGAVTLTFTSCGAMRLAYAGPVGASFSLDLTRLVGPLSGIACVDQVAGGSAADIALRALLPGANQTGDARTGRTLPSIDDPLPQLGKLLFFSKTLSGDLDTACASCHHPGLGGADGLALSVGTGASQPHVMGAGRVLTGGGFSTSRNSNTFFNVALWDQGLFWDSRVESIGKIDNTNGAGSGIRTPDTGFGVADAAAGPNLPAAQARFPVVSVKEMKGTTAFAGLTDAQVRERLAARLGNYGAGTGALAPSNWLQRFRTAYANPNGSAEQLITFDNIARAIAEYQRSATFTNNAWSRYVRGDNTAIDDQAKAGAIAFFTPATAGGAECSRCHRGNKLTDESHRAVGFPQVGPGMGDGANGTDDFGRMRATGNSFQQYLYRTPSLLNVEVTAPYGHSGSYATLDLAFRHYILPEDTTGTLLSGRGWCSIPGFAQQPGCGSDFASAIANSNAAFTRVLQERGSSPATAMPIVDSARFSPAVNAQVQIFMRTLTDPCVKDRSCLARWVPRADEAPDAHQLNATDASGNPL